MTQETPQRFCDKHRLKLDPTLVPEKFHPLIPLAEKWGMNYIDGLVNYDILFILFAEASLEEIQELVDTVSPYMGPLYHEWLAGEAATTSYSSEGYIAFTMVGMACSDGMNILAGKSSKPQMQSEFGDFVRSMTRW